LRWRHYKIARERMVKEQLYKRGIRDKRVLEVMLRVPRHVFLDHDAGSEAYSDHSFPIGYSQTMSQPHMVAYLSAQLELAGDERVLEIGTGSGYHAAVLGNLAAEVYSVERVPELASRARDVLRDLIYTNVHVKTGDGAEGWKEAAPFDRILLTAAARSAPKALLAQLRDGGFLLGPVEKTDGGQELVRLRRSGNSFSIERLGECSFVPMVRSGSETGTISHGRPHGR
jgi:protein-L-isoaspartate(D-aspartate) O-methyltransferase